MRLSLKGLTPEAMKLLGSTKGKINQKDNDKNLPQLEIAGVILLN